MHYALTLHWSLKAKLRAQNKALDAAFVFGGYNPAMMSNVTDENGRERSWQFQYFADTFMLDMGSRASQPDEPLRWKHVLTRGFPTYRANSKLVTDPATFVPLPYSFV